MQRSTKIKIGLLSASLVLALGTGVYQVNTWSNSYSKMEQQEIQNFDTLWSKVWDAKNKTFSARLDPATVQQLSTLAGTPAQKQQLDLAKASLPLVTVKYQDSTLAQLIAAANAYYQFEASNTNYPEQIQFNKQVVAEIEHLVANINQNLDKLTLADNTISFDKTVKTDLAIDTIASNLKWADLPLFNKHLNQLNNLIQKQIQENKDRDEQEEIIQLKEQLDSFVAKAKEYQTSIKQDYISIKDLKTILNKLTNLDVSKHQDWFTLKPYEKTAESSTYNTTFTSKFFADNKELEPYKDQLVQITIPVAFTRTLLEVTQKSEEKNDQTFTYVLNTSVSQTDTDLVNKNTLKNIAIRLGHKQTVKTYVEPPKPETTPSTSTTSVTPESSTAPTTEVETTASTTEIGTQDRPIPIRGGTRTDAP